MSTCFVKISQLVHGLPVETHIMHDDSQRSSRLHQTSFLPCFSSVSQSNILKYNEAVVPPQCSHNRRLPKQRPQTNEPHKASKHTKFTQAWILRHTHAHKETTEQLAIALRKNNGTFPTISSQITPHSVFSFQFMQA